MALKVLLEQPEVDKGNITLIGHSEGAVMAPRIVSKQPQDVKNVVLMGASSQTLYDLVIEKAAIIHQDNNGIRVLIPIISI